MVVVDASEDMRLLFRGLLESRVGFSVVGEAADVDTALRLDETEEPDLVIVDAGLLGDDGARTVAMLARRPTSKVVVVFADDSTEVEAMLEAGAFMVLDREAALRITTILEGGSPPRVEQATVSIDRAIEVACRCDRDDCGGTIRFVALPSHMLTDGTASGACLRCGTAYQLLNSMTELAEIGDHISPAAHKLLNAAAISVDAVRAARSGSTETDDAQTRLLLDIAERQCLAVVEGLRELILGLPVGALSFVEHDDPSEPRVDR